MILTYFGVLILMVVGWCIARHLLTLIPCSNLRDKYVLVTGCDSGMGRLVALNLVARKMNVFAACLTVAGHEQLEGLKAKETLDNLHVIQLDITKPDQIRKVRDMIKEKTGSAGLWALLNNAGYYRTELLELADWELWKAHIEVNVLGTAAVTKEMIPLIRLAKGRIINIASASILFAPPFHTAYCASKFALCGMTDALRREMAIWDVKAILVAPGVTTTPLFDRDRTADMQACYERMTDEQKQLFGMKFLKFSLQEKEEGLKVVSSPAESAAGTIANSVYSRFPYTRYTTGVDSIFYQILYYLPTSFVDAFATYFMLHVKLPPQTLQDYFAPPKLED